MISSYNHETDRYRLILTRDEKAVIATALDELAKLIDTLPPEASMRRVLDMLSDMRTELRSGH